MKIRADKIIATIILVLAVATVLYPLFWVLITSFKSNQDFFTNIWGLPREFKFENYTRAWNMGMIGRGFFNSILVTSVSLVLGVAFASTTAYVLARFNFRGREFLRNFYLLALMVPVVITIIPQYFLLGRFSLLDNLLGIIIIYSLSSLPFAQFVLYGFYRTLPHELEEAALIDGANQYITFFRIMLPMAQPGIITIAVVMFINYWNEYFQALTFLSTPEKYTISVGLVNLLQQTQYRTDWGGLMAGNVILIIPTITAYIIFQNKISKGLTSGAVKG